MLDRLINQFLYIPDMLMSIRRQLVDIAQQTAQFQYLITGLENTMRAEVQAKFEELKATISAESLEVQEAIKSSVATATETLEAQVEELKQALAEGEDPAPTLAEIEEAIAEVKAIVSTEAPAEEPTPVEELPAEEPTV